jgi:glycosyltransferase involved in cell wall biosynthesis
MVDKRLKICVYAIAKNEAKHVKRFCESATDADYIVIADTGSTDETIQIARDCGATVHSIAITPWRFDTARNAALALVPADVDICVSLDLDEVLEPGWREEIERVWTDGVTKMRHRFDFTCGHIYNAERIHARHGYVWKYPCHEFQVPDGRIAEQYAESAMILMTHNKDPEKSRGQYLDLLESAIRENPDCRRSQYYYARELYYYYRWQDAINEFNKYLVMKDATWDAERCYARRIMGECYEALRDYKNAETAYMLACTEASNTRDPWLSLARFYYRRENWAECYGALIRMFRIEVRNYEYTAIPQCWSHDPYDLAALSAWNLGMKDAAVFYGEKAFELNPDDTRLADNLAHYHGGYVLQAAE